MKTLFISLSVILTMFLQSVPVNAQALYFYVVNNTNHTLNGVFVTPAEHDSWGADLLPDGTFESGATVKFSIPEEVGKTCRFDMKIADVSGLTVIFYGIDACKLLTLKLNWDGTYETEDDPNYNPQNHADPSPSENQNQNQGETQNQQPN